VEVEESPVAHAHLFHAGMKDKVRNQLEAGVRRQNVEQHKQQQPAIAPARHSPALLRRLNRRRGHALAALCILNDRNPRIAIGNIARRNITRFLVFLRLGPACADPVAQVVPGSFPILI
jgi:hypothetical protein